jgi:hypothetical protein
MLYLGIFIFGAFCGRYILDWLDVLNSFISNRNALDAAKIQKAIDELKSDCEGSPAIGFTYEPVEEIDEEEDECQDFKVKPYDVLNYNGEKVIGFKL